MARRSHIAQRLLCREVRPSPLERLYPNEKPLIVGDVENFTSAAFLCVGYFYSDTPTMGQGSALMNYSVLLVCALIENINQSVRNIACELLAMADWETGATDDTMW